MTLVPLIADVLLLADVEALHRAVDQVLAATLLLAIGLWLLLPRGVAAGRSLGAIFVAAGLGLYAAQLPRLGSWAAESLFFILAAVTVVAAVATVTFRNPVYSAIWFGLSLVGTAGLFLFQGAQFLGVATIVVYAGAILVTFLFVLMLAQPKGQAPYDRMSWAPRLSAITGALVVGLLTLTLVAVFENPDASQRPHAAASPEALAGDILADEHMARLGAQLFGNYLIPLEVAGTLLLVALVGTVAIASQLERPGRAEVSRMDELALLQNFLVVGAMLFGIGLVGFFSRRNMIVMFLSAEMMLQGVSVSLVAWGRYHNDWGGQMLVIFILTVAACEAAIALAVVLSLFHKSGSLDISLWQQLREDNQPAQIERAAPAEPSDETHWPKLAPAGVEPQADPDEILYRSHV